MGSEVVVTYKRKRLFSRSDHSYTNLHSDTPFEISKSKTKDFCKHVGAVEENILQNKDPEIGICYRYSKEKGDEEAPQCENCDPHYCSQYSEKLAVKPELPEQQDSSVSNQTQKLTPEPMKLSLKCDVKQNAFNPNVILEGQIDSGSQSNGGGPSKSGLECEEKCNEALSKEPNLFRLEASDGITCSDQIKGSSISGEEINKLNKDQHNSLCDNSLAKRKFPSTLITYCRRSKRSRGVGAPDTASESETPPASCCLVDLNDAKVQLTNSFTDSEEKNPTVDIDKSWSFSVPAPATAMAIHTDNPLNGEAKSTRTAAADDTCEEMPLLREKVVRDDYHIDVGPQSLSSEDFSIVSEKRDSQFSLDLSISSRDSRDIDCNRPLDCGSDKNYTLEPADVPHDPVGSTSKLEEKISTLQVDKGKRVIDPQPVFTGTSSKNCCLQLFPEKSEKLSQFRPSTLHPPNFHSLSGQIADNRAFYAPSYQWLPNIQAQPRESFHNFLQSTADRTRSFSTQNILSRARAVMAKKSSFLDQFNYPSTWSEDELDSLWIGVRRHGRGNWNAILRDRSLHFSPWRTTWDLDEKWQGEQSKIFCNTPISQLNFANNKENGQLQRPGANTVPLSSCSYLTNGWWGALHPPIGDESSSNTGPMKGGLPHWLRAAVVAPPRPFDPTQIVGSSVCHSGIGWLAQPGFECRQPWSNSRYASALMRTEPHSAAVRRGKTQLNEHLGRKEDELIIIPSDASSEETISDDPSIRP